mmetsp:Transcript_16268/g.41493  ORF Transcript_16268/g.41493 Transcript_16268/m.41493 type:complete len:236 (-) Transcript_16268:218-925(-)
MRGTMSPAQTMRKPRSRPRRWRRSVSERKAPLKEREEPKVMHATGRPGGAMSRGQSSRSSAARVASVPPIEWPVKITWAVGWASSASSRAAIMRTRGDAATRLLHRYYKHATADESVKKTFKCIGQARNFDDLGLPSWMRRFNAKPVIINKSGEVYTGEVRGVRYLEIDILVGKWGLMARRGLLSLLPRYKDLDCEIGFVLQGHEDSELPERILGGARLPFVDPETAFVPWAPPS